MELIKNRNVGIIGMARSGVAAAEMVNRHGGTPFVSDLKAVEELAESVSRLERQFISYECGGHSERLLGADYLVVSPGVPASLGILQRAEERGIPIFSEIEFASWMCAGKIIAITGSNGKTTTTSLVGEMFAASGATVYVAGNIGSPFAEVADKIPSDGFAVLEISSFQLERIERFDPHVAVLLNITPDHLDRYFDFEAYADAKYRIFENQTESDYAVLNIDDSTVSNHPFPYRSKRLLVSTAEESSAARIPEGVFQRGKRLSGRVAGRTVEITDIDAIRLPGSHNLSNIAMAAAAALACGIDNKAIARVLRTFSGVEHRLEDVAEIEGVRFVNDSKGTNIDAQLVALQAIEGPINLIAGGRDKEGDFTRLLPHARDKVRYLILLGEAKDKIFEQLGRSIPSVMASSMADAVNKAFELSHPGDTVLLSPGCASFDMYRNFEERGKDFKSEVRRLKNGTGSGAAVEV